ncbi:MAG: O-antigen ligase family protein [Geminicoccaceae bacterium]|nr:O-antigen ligase family protein [Geminicoccaceae bacterium]
MLIAVLAAAPLPLGANRPWPWSLLALVTGVMLLASLLIRREPEAEVRHAASIPLPATIGFVGVCIWAWLQSVPLGIGALAHPRWSLLALIDAEGEPLIGLDGQATREALMRLSTYGAAFWLASRLAVDREQAKRLLTAVIAIGAAYAAYGLANHFLKIGWVVPGVPRITLARLQSVFVNPNNYATFANISLMAVLASLLSPLLEVRDWTQYRQRMGEILSTPRGVLLLLALMLLGFSSLLSGSRGGLLSLALALATMTGIVVWLSRTPLAVRLMLPVILAAVLVGALTLSGDYSLTRIGRAVGMNDARVAIYDLTLKMISDRPWLGQGYGNYEAAFAAWRDERLTAVVDKAHNTYLEHVAELGIPAAIVLYAGILAIILRIAGGLVGRRRDKVYPLAALSAALVAGLHALVDFSLQIPAIGFTLAVVLGIGIAQSTSSRVRVELRPD